MWIRLTKAIPGGKRGDGEAGGGDVLRGREGARGVMEQLVVVMGRGEEKGAREVVVVGGLEGSGGEIGGGGGGDGLVVRE